MSSSLALLKQEILNTQETQHDLAKWKLLVTAALGSAALGLTKETSSYYWIFLFVPFVCAYIDLHDCQYQLRILAIAAFLRRQSKNSILCDYEKECQRKRQRHYFSLGKLAGFGSSLVAMAFGPLFYVFNSSHTISKDLSITGPEAVAIYIAGVFFDFGVYANFVFIDHKLRNPQTYGLRFLANCLKLFAARRNVLLLVKIPGRVWYWLRRRAKRH